MEILKHDESDAESLIQKISSRIQSILNDGTPFFLFVQDARVEGLLVIRHEPTYLLAEAGAAYGSVVCFVEDTESLRKVLDASVKLMDDRNLSYLIHSKQKFTTEERTSLEEHGLKLMDHSYEMSVDIHEFLEIPEGLVLRPMRIEERDRFLRVEEEFFEGSGDRLSSLMIHNIRTLSQETLDIIYNEDTSYYVFEGELLVGIVVVFVDNGGIASIAVEPNLRGKGYGRKILAMALNRLKELGWERAWLRVDAENAPAIAIYDALGFVKTNERFAFIRFGQPVP